MATTPRPQVTFVYDVLELLEVVPGAWCNRCLLPSADTIIIASQLRGGPLKLSSRTRCGECDHWDH